MHKRLFIIMTLGLALLAAQVKTEIPPVEPAAKPVRVEPIKIHGASLEGNLEGEAVDRDALVFLPPGYATAKSRRYPVVYALHGYSIGAEQWSKEIHVPQTIEGAFAKGAQEMIVVLPDSKTVSWGIVAWVLWHITRRWGLSMSVSEQCWMRSGATPISMRRPRWTRILSKAGATPRGW